MSGIKPPGAGGGPGPGGCASYVYQGLVEIATFAETAAGTYLGGSGCPLAVNPANLFMRQEVATGAKFSPFSVPVNFVGPFGAYALDIQSQRTNVANAALGAGSVVLGLDNRTGVFAANAMGIGVSNVATGGRGVAIGVTNQAYGNNTNAIGYRNQAGQNYGVANDAQAIGRSNFAYAMASLSIGIMNNVQAPGNLNDATGVIGGDPQLRLNNSINSWTWGIANQNYYGGLRSGAVGFKNRVGSMVNPATDCIAIGNFNAVQGTYAVAVGVRNTAGSLAQGGAAFGYANTANAYRSLVLGHVSQAYGASANAIGDRATARVDQTTQLASAIIIKRDDGEALADAVRAFAGADDFILSNEIDLTAAPAEYQIALPANCHFWWNECGIILTQAVAALVVQPTVRFGIAGLLDKYVAVTITTTLTAIYRRERFFTWQVASDDGEVDLSFGVTISATAGTLIGRAYWLGMLVEDE